MTEEVIFEYLSNKLSLDIDEDNWRGIVTIKLRLYSPGPDGKPTEISSVYFTKNQGER